MIARMQRSAQAIRQALLDLFFPPRCVICHDADPDWFCTACRSQIERILPPLCDRCGRPLRARTCPYCQTLALQIDGIRAMAFFEGNLREAIHAFKYQHRPELARVLGQMLGGYLSAHPLPVDAITAVPLHAERERARGYNQARLLARALGAHQNLPVWDSALTRVRATQSQIDLDAAERRANVQDAFAADRRVCGARLLLIDDVCTTGATMDACSVALKQRGAKSVWGLALARGR
ncbi:MAG: ComF family protein [Chloroflexota bacterium]|nr:ComF family protein [Chloroflexota bacterium]